MHYILVKWPLKYLNTPASWLSVQQFVQVEMNGNIKALHHWPFLKGIHWWLVHSPHKWPATQRVFPMHDIILEEPSQHNFKSFILEVLNNTFCWPFSIRFDHWKCTLFTKTINCGWIWLKFCGAMKKLISGKTNNCLPWCLTFDPLNNF